MAVYQLQDVVRDVRVALDENRESQGFLIEGDMETYSLDSMVRGYFPSSARAIEVECPIRYLSGGVVMNGDPEGGIHWVGDRDTCGWFELPEDFLRLISFKMDDWSYSLHHAVEPGGLTYRIQGSSVHGVRGHSERPVCAVVQGSTGLRMEFWSCDTRDACIERLVYAPVPVWDKQDGIIVCGDCYMPAVYACGSMVADALGHRELSQHLQALSEGLLVDK